MPSSSRNCGYWPTQRKLRACKSVPVLRLICHETHGADKSHKIACSLWPTCRGFLLGMAWLQADTGHAQTQGHLQACEDFQLPHRQSCKRHASSSSRRSSSFEGSDRHQSKSCRQLRRSRRPSLRSAFAPGFRRETALACSQALQQPRLSTIVFDFLCCSRLMAIH